MLDGAGFVPIEQRRFAVPLAIGVLGDTHVNPRGQRRLPAEVPELFRRFRVGLILHTGDVNTAALLAGLAAIAPVLAVVGNNDDRELRALLPESLEFQVDRFRFGLTHGLGRGTARQEVRRRYAGRVDCAVYGHSHIPLIERVGETILFNPGSPTDRRWGPHFGLGLIHVTTEKIEPELVLFTDPRHLANVRP
jgi:putative phosphoesterase